MTKTTKIADIRRGQLIGAIAACGMAATWAGTAAAQPITFDSDTLITTVDTQAPVVNGLNEVNEPGTATTNIPATTIPYGPGNSVVLPVLPVRLLSDNEAGNLPVFTPSMGAIQRVVPEIGTTLTLTYFSDGDPTPPGGVSDTLSWVLSVPGAAPDVLASVNLLEPNPIGPAESGMLNTGEIEIGISQGVGTCRAATPTVPADFSGCSDILIVGSGAISITANSDGDTPPEGVDVPTLNFPLTIEVPVPEPGSLALLGAALAGFGFLRRRRNAR